MGVAPGIRAIPVSSQDYFPCGQTQIESLIQVNRLAHEFVLGKDGKGQEEFSKTFASDRLVDTPEIMNELNALFPEGHIFGKARGVYVQPWGNAHLLRVSFEAPAGEKREIVMRSSPGKEFGRVKSMGIDYVIEQGAFGKEKGELCRSEIATLDPALLFPRAISKAVTQKIVAEPDLKAQTVVTGVERSKKGDTLISKNRVTVDGKHLAESPAEKFVTATSTHTLPETPIPKTSASLTTETKLNTAEVGTESLSTSQASLETKVTEKLKTQVSGGYLLTEQQVTDVRSGASSELALDKKTKLTVAGVRTEKTDSLATDNALNTGIGVGAVTVGTQLGRTLDGEGEADAKRRGVTTAVKVDPKTTLTVGVAETESLKVESVDTTLSAGVTRGLANGGSVVLSGTRAADSDAFGVSLTASIPLGASPKPVAAEAPKGPQLKEKRKEIVQDPVSGKWVYVMRYYDDRGQVRGEFVTTEEAPDPTTLIRE